MQIQKITARRTVQKSIGQYEYDQRVFEYEAVLSPGESVEVATLALNAALAGCFSVKPAEAVAEPVQEDAVAPVPEATPAAVANSEPALPADEAVMDLAEFTTAVAVRAKEVGARRVLDLRDEYGVATIKDLHEGLRAEFLAKLA